MSYASDFKILTNSMRIEQYSTVYRNWNKAPILLITLIQDQCNNKARILQITSNNSLLFIDHKIKHIA